MRRTGILYLHKKDKNFERKKELFSKIKSHIENYLTDLSTS
jgi:hypothetical protein